MAVIKNKDTEESRQFWSHVEAVAHQVKGWPSWTENRTTSNGAAESSPSSDNQSPAATASTGDEKT